VVSAIPKGLSRLAQGCEERATLGASHIGLNPNGVVSPRRRRAATPLGLFALGDIPRVARASPVLRSSGPLRSDAELEATAEGGQPWALSRNPFGIHLWNFRRALAPVLLLFVAVNAIAADRTGSELERRFADKVHPFLETYCFGCHGKEKQKGKLDLSVYSTVEAVALDYRRWEVVLDKLKAEDMPPEEAKQHPMRELRQGVIDWIQAMRQHEARRNAGDPGPVLARRLSNAEYNYTIRDLTGVDIRPAHEFPVDPANEAGFDNSGESLAMSSALLNKYLEASRRVAEHIVLTPAGFVFAPHPMVTETDRDKYCVRRIIDFYQKQPTDLADYFMAASRKPRWPTSPRKTASVPNTSR
jgi:Protein of unknown function (DUF1587)/Planctomycete cytochrome C